jgi:hypothetical protein
LNPAAEQTFSASGGQWTREFRAESSLRDIFTIGGREKCMVQALCEAAGGEAKNVR